MNNKEAPEFEPYIHLYAARDILEKSIKEIETKLKNDALSADQKHSLETDCIILKHHLGLNYNDTEERSQATPILSEVISYLTTSQSLRTKHIVILMKSINYLAIIWSSMQEEQKSKKYLDQNEQLYKECYSNDNMALIAKTDVNELESEYTHTLFYMAQLYKNLNQTHKSAMCCHKTLQRQLKYDQHNLNRKEWVENALGLATFYTNNERFRQSIHCIEAAIKISEKIKSANGNAEDDEKEEDNDDDDMNVFEDEEEQKKMKADIARAWGSLYAEILKKSYAIVSSIKSEQDAGSEEKALADTQKLIALDAKLKIDNSLSMFEEIDGLQPPVEMQLASSYAEAKELFIPALSHNMNALEFYVLNGFVTDHTKISQTVSQIYKFLAYFEADKSTKCKLHKRRINLLKPIESEISVNAYQDIVQSLCYELGSIHENMGSLKKEIYDQQQQDKNNNAKAPMDGAEAKQIKKINDLLSRFV